MLISAKDKENQEIIEGLRERENEYKRKLSIAETNESINKERVAALTNEMYRISHSVSESMVDKTELVALEHKLTSEMTPMKEYNKVVESYENLQANVDKEYVSNAEYAGLHDELDRAHLDIKVLSETTNVLMHEKELLHAENAAIKDKLNSYILRCEKYEAELVDLRLKVHDHDNEMNNTKIVMGGIKSIIGDSSTIVHSKSLDEDKVSLQTMPLLLQLSKVKLQLRHEQEGKKEVHGQLDGCEEKYQKLLAESENAKISYDEDMRKRDDELKIKMLERDKEVTEKESEVMEWKASCHELESKVGELESKVNALNNKIIRLKQEKEQLENMTPTPVNEAIKNDNEKDEGRVGAIRKHTSSKKTKDSATEDLNIEKVISVNSLKTFEKYLSRSDVLIVVYFSGSWVVPCNKIKESGVYNKLCKQFADVMFLEIDEESKPDSHEIFKLEKVKAMPTVHFYCNRRLVYQLDGFDEVDLAKKIKVHAEKNRKLLRTATRRN